MAVVSDIEDMYELAASGYLTNDDAKTVVEQAWQQLSNARQELDSSDIENDSAERLNAVEEKLRSFHANGVCPSLPGIPSLEVNAIQKVFWAVATNVPSARTAREIMDHALKSINDN